MNIKTNLLKRAQAWLKKNWEENEWYNVSMNKLSKTTAPDWFIEFVTDTFNPLVKVVTEIKQDVAVLKQDMIEVKKDIVELKQDVAVLKQDMIEVKKDIVELKQDVAILKQDMIEVKKDIVELKRDVALIMSLPTIQRELKLKNKIKH